jgi:sortase A
MLRLLINILKWAFITAGLLLVAFGAGISMGIPVFSRLVEPVSAAIDPAAPPWDQFDPYLVSVTTPSQPNGTNLPDTFQVSSERALTAVFGSEDPLKLLPERLVIPSINLEAPIVTTGVKKYNINGNIYEQWIVPNIFAAGWNPASSYPGQTGNTVLFGHHNVNGAVFANLYKVQEGDEISVFAGGLEYRYKVDQVIKVKEKDVSFAQMVENGKWIENTEDERLTLVTCWPPYASTYRLIVVAKPILQ